MRSSIGANSGEPGVETVATKSMIARLARPSFHEGRGPEAGAVLARSVGWFMIALPIGLRSPAIGVGYVLTRLTKTACGRRPILRDRPQASAAHADRGRVYERLARVETTAR